MRHLEVQAVFAACQVRQLRHQCLESGGDGQRDHGVEDGAHAQAGQADQQGKGQRDGQSPRHASKYRGPGRSHPHAGDRHAVRADPEEHGVREADDAGVAQQQVIAGDENDEHQDLRGYRERLRARKQKRRGSQRGHDHDEQQRQHRAARRIAGKQAYRHVGGS
ncbi:hypothetical protein D3C72_1750790 [compost metagenome]